MSGCGLRVIRTLKFGEFIRGPSRPAARWNSPPGTPALGERLALLPSRLAQASLLAQASRCTGSIAVYRGVAVHLCIAVHSALGSR